MLNDRNYMENPVRNARNQEISGMKCVFILIAINVVIYFMQGMMGEDINELILTPAGIKQYKIWQLVTNTFLHGGFLHLLFNMYGIYLFGSILAPRVGGKKFLNIYFRSHFAGVVIKPGFFFS